MKRAFALVIAAIIFVFAALPAFAAQDDNPSPTRSSHYYKVYLHNHKGGKGTYTEKRDKDGQHVTLTAHPKNGYKFTKWVIKGKYKLVKGKLTDDEIVVELQSDIHVYPHFVDEGGRDNSTKVSENSSPTSPKTGGDPAPFAILGSVLGIAVLSAIGVKLAVSKK